MTVDIDRLRALEKAATLEPDYEDGLCVRCHCAMQTDDGCDQTAECHQCARDMLDEVCNALPELLAEVESGRKTTAAIDDFRSAIIAHHDLGDAIHALFDKTLGWRP